MAESSGNTVYSCRNCRNPLAIREDLLSKAFRAKSGQAYLFSNAMNIAVGQKEDKQLLTGLFTISKIYCKNCNAELGWKYVRAYDERQKYKQGRFILEKMKIAKEY